MEFLEWKGERREAFQDLIRREPPTMEIIDHCDRERDDGSEKSPDPKFFRRQIIKEK